MTEWILLADGNPVAEIAKSFSVTWQTFLSQLVLVLLVAVSLKKWAFGPIQKVLEERRERIAKGLADAEQMERELASARAKAQGILEDANAQAGKLIEEARAAAARVREAETQKAIASANDIVAKARQAMDAERHRMLGDLRREVGRLVVATTARVTGKVLSPDDQQRLAEEANRHLAA
jgi:F-type H+-transporting ATPase subunit b